MVKLKQLQRPVIVDELHAHLISRPDIPETAETIRKAKEDCEAAREAARAAGVPWNCAPPIADEFSRRESRA